jgi:hypothetical protein
VVACYDWMNLGRHQMQRSVNVAIGLLAAAAETEASYAGLDGLLAAVAGVGTEAAESRIAADGDGVAFAAEAVAAAAAAAAAAAEVARNCAG